MRELKKVTDHKGIEYRCMQDMCAAYNMIPNTVRRRLAHGATLEEALAPVVKPEKKKGKRKK